MIAGETESQQGKALGLVTVQCGWVARERTPGVPSAHPLFSVTRTLHTQPLEVSSPNMADAVEAGVQVSGCLGKRRDVL